MEILVILVLIFALRLLRHASSPPRQVRIDVHHHFYLVHEQRGGGEVVPFRPRIVK